MEEETMRADMNWRSFAAIIVIFSGLIAAPLGEAFADDPPPIPLSKVVPPDGNINGMSYGDWSTAWWQYVLSLPPDNNPVFDATGEKCGVGQSAGPVFFLVGSGGEPTTRNCTVPAGKALVFPIVNVECSNLEDAPFFGGDEHGLRVCAATFMDGVDPSTLKVSVDGEELANPGLFRAQSPVFSFTMPRNDNFLGLNGKTTGLSVSDGYWAIVEPLTVGNHVIHFEGAFVSGPGAGFAQDVTYNLTVE